MTRSQSIFQSASWEEMVEATKNAAIHKSIKQGGSYNPNQLVKVMTARVRYLRRYRLNSTIKNKSSVENCYASDLLSNSTITVIGKVLMPPMNSSGTLHSNCNAKMHPSSKFKGGTSVDDDMSDLSMSSEEEEGPDCFKNSSLEYVWILGMRFVVFDSSITNTH
jgi:hypothetical protein